MRPRIDKLEHDHRLRGSWPPPSERGERMRFAGIDIAAETHFVAVVDERSEAVTKPTSFREDAAGYEKRFTLLRPASDLLIAMDATGHYWQNLFAALAAGGYAVALLNPLRTRRFAGEDLERTKTDAIDALRIARFAAQKHPVATHLPNSAIQDPRELVRFRDRLMQDFGDRVRQLHRLVDLGFPEFTRYVRSLDSEPASVILHEGLLARGKLPKVALVAAMRNLLVALYFVVKHPKPFVPILAEAPR